MRRLLRSAAWPLLLAAAGCAVGTTANTFQPARGPAGVEASLNVQGRRDPVIGEVLAVRDTGLVVLVEGRVTLVPYAVLRAAAFQQVGEVWLSGKRPDPGLEERIRLVSRFPQGLSPDVERSLLTAYGQQVIDVLAL